MDCSPELAGEENDYTIYAVDVSEPDTPLVGQGMLSWALDSMRNESTVQHQQQPKMVTGRVTKNLLGVFGGGNRETLEVRLKLMVASRPNRHVRHNSGSGDMQSHQPQQLQLQQNMQPSRPSDTALTPTGTSEWNSFIQSNPHIGQQGHVSRVASPALSLPPTQPNQSMMNRRDSFDPSSQQGMPGTDIQRVAPIPVNPGEQPGAGAGGNSSRPSSRASNRAPRKKAPTGRPRGRPRKKPAEGNTSGYEDGTEGEDGPAKKRAKTTKVDRASNPFANGPESLRVAASTSGSLRNFRPVGASNDGAPTSGSHLQEVPRAPTPVPEGGPFRGAPSKGRGSGQLRRESSLGQHAFANQQSLYDSRQPPSPGQDDGRSPDSLAATPTYSVDSPADIGSSPPVQQATPFLRSSPPPSSPILPPMPGREESVLADEIDDLFGENPKQAPPRDMPAPPYYPMQRKPTEATNANGVPIQVFKMQPGTAGNEMVHIFNYNTPQLQLQQRSDAPCLPPLKHQSSAARTKKGRTASPPVMAPTPPPTTDAAEKPPSPLQLVESASDSTTLTNSVGSAPAGEPQLHNISASRPATSQHPRQLSRSQSAGPLMLPATADSEPIGRSGLSQSALAEPQAPSPPAATALKRASSSGPLSLPVPASDPVVSIAAPSAKARLEAAMAAMSGAKSDAPIPPPSSPPATRSNKNIVKKHAIKQRLEEAIENGELPPYCTNCGAIETPTWRKIWIQDHEGVPEYYEYSEKPGKVTAIEVLRRDADDTPTFYRVIKKSLGPAEDRSKWEEQLLCNPCGIWLTKFKCHRPQDKWDKDPARLGPERRRRGAGRNNKKSRGKGVEGLTTLTSEACLPTDALGSIEPSSPKVSGDGSFDMSDLIRTDSNESQEFDLSALIVDADAVEGDTNPGSSHSSGNKDSKSPADAEVDETMGTTKRLLFPSPRKDGEAKSLGELDVNIVRTDDLRRPKDQYSGKENVVAIGEDVTTGGRGDDQRTSKASMARPSTPPPNAKDPTSTEPFKTPSRQTPSHRPITRSISKSIRSIKSIIGSPSQRAAVQQTPSKTPRRGQSVLGSIRRSPRNHQPAFDVFDTPISRTINQMFSEATCFGDNELDLSSLPALDERHGGLIDFGSLLSTDAVMPSSPPKDGSLSFDYSATSNVWGSWDMDDACSMDAN